MVMSALHSQPDADDAEQSATLLKQLAFLDNMLDLTKHRAMRRMYARDFKKEAWQYGRLFVERGFLLVLNENKDKFFVLLYDMRANHDSAADYHTTSLKVAYADVHEVKAGI